MKVFLFFLLITTHLWAKTESQCEVIEGFYQNSEVQLTNIKLETFADIFTLNNAKTLSFEYANQVIRFQRNDMRVSRYTKMEFAGVSDLSKTHAAVITIDRKPKAALNSQEFYASLMVTMPLEVSKANSVLVYNLFCKF